MIAPVVKSLVLQGFRSVPGTRLELDNPTFLVGRNGSGKSNLVDAFAFLGEAMASPLGAAFERRGSLSVVLNRSPGSSEPAHLGLGVELGRLGRGEVVGARYAFEVRFTPRHGFEVAREQCKIRLRDGASHWFEREGGEFRSNVPGLEPALEPAALGLPVVGGDARFAPVLRTLAAIQVHSIEPARLRELQDSNGGRRLRRDGANCAGVLQDIAEESPEDMTRIREVLATIVPDVREMRVREHGGKLALEFIQANGDEGLRFDASGMSDGALRAVGLLAAVYQRPKPSLLIIEEPEATIHTGAIGAISDLLRHAARSVQVLVTTHSPELLDADWIEDRHLRVTEWERGATHVSRVSEATRQALARHVMGAGELLRSNALEATAARDAGPVLFEGDPR